MIAKGIELQSSTGMDFFNILTTCHKIKLMNTVIHFYPCNPALYFQTTYYVFVYRIL